LSVPPFVTIEQKRELVYAYVGLPHGSKAGFLRERGLTGRRMRTWRAQVFAGTLELGLVPRGGSLVSVDESGLLARLIEENRVLQEQLRVQQAGYEQAMAVKEAELSVQVRAVDALGKAIEMLRQLGAGSISQERRVEDGHR
jgi:hypothetical protein